VKYGQVKEIVPAPGKKSKRSGLVEMATRVAAESAARIETGLCEAPLKVVIVDEQGKEEEPFTPAEAARNTMEDSLVTGSDFESMVMLKLRQAEARKAEIQRIMEEDAKEEEELKRKPAKSQ